MIISISLDLKLLGWTGRLTEGYIDDLRFKVVNLLENSPEA
jgi:hypothetical protein